jgi:hypothetical protein
MEIHLIRHMPSSGMSTCEGSSVHPVPSGKWEDSDYTVFEHELNK